MSRCSKRIFRSYIQAVSSTNLSAAISHYLNCFLSNFVKTTAQSASSTAASVIPASAASNAQSQTTADSAELQVTKASTNKKRKKNQKGKSNRSPSAEKTNEWCNLSPRLLWSILAEEAMAQYNFDLKL